MRKQTFLLIAGIALTFAACNQPAGEPSQATIDSMVNAKLDVLKMEWAAKNDSIINAMAQMKADSMIAAMNTGGGKKTTTKTTTKNNTTTPTTTTTNDDKTTKDGRLNTKDKDNDGRLDTKGKDKKNDGRLDIGK